MSSLKLYNTLIKSIVDFKPLNGDKVNLFVCGPTVYDFAHIGNAKTYTQFDFIAKYLRFRGYDVFYLQNITNIDDKIISRSKEQGISWDELANKFTDVFLEDMKSMYNDAVTKFAKATDYIPQIVNQVKTLLDKGYAYKTTDGIYYDIQKFKDYGKLSGRTEADQDAGVSRIDDSLDKKNKNDFCLWKFSKPDEPSWETELGKGRPGWHIEDTAITETIFGPQYDIHGGAVDLIFPHHEAEIAQMEAASGKSPLVQVWMHVAFLNTNSAKMSKSRGNFTSMREAINDYGYRLLRFFFISNHYRTPLDYSDQNLIQAKNTLSRLDSFVQNIDKNLDDDVSSLKAQIIEAIDNDFDTPKAFALIFDYIRKNRNSAGKNAYKLFQELDQFFNFIEFEKAIPEEIQKLLSEREQLRKEKNYAQADAIRNQIEKLGYTVMDTK